MIQGAGTLSERVLKIVRIGDKIVALWAFFYREGLLASPMERSQGLHLAP